MRILLLMGFLAVSTALYAEETTRLRHYIPNSKYIYYNDRSITMQAARFELPAPGYLRELRIMLGGSRSATAVLHIYGEEGGLNAPIVQVDLISPLTIRKTKSGIEQVIVQLPEPVYIGGEQFFVALDNMTSGMQLLSDKKIKSPSCVSGSDSYYYQMLRGKEGTWQWGKFGFAIDVDVEYRKSTGSAKFFDVTATLIDRDTILPNGGICWADINGDRYLDLLAGGRLYKNDAGRKFTDITATAGISGRPELQAFIDANNDGIIDILFFADSGSARTILFKGRGDGTFHRTSINLSGLVAPACFAIADANGDGFLDLYVGQGNEVIAEDRHLLFINNRGRGFTRDTAAFSSPFSGPPIMHGALAAQWVDVDGDGRQELFTAGDRGSTGVVWRSDSSGRYAASPLSDDMWQGVGCGWSDFDNDGDADLLLPKSIDHSGFRKSGGEIARFIHENGDPGDRQFGNAIDIPDLRYMAERSGGSWGDIDNDGLQDFILTSSSRCGYVNVHMQTAEGEFEDRTFDCGMRRVSGGKDAVWVDYDNDGRLDLSMLRDGRLAIYRNESATTNNYIAIELTDQTGTEGGMGAKVTIHAGEKRYTREVTSGRGLGMQDPARLHFGIGPATRIDSVTVQPSSSSGRVTFTDLETNRLHRLVVDRARVVTAGVSIDLSAAPNPFTDRLRFSYTLAHRQHVRLEIYSSAGHRIATVVDEEQGAGEQTLTWEAKDETGKRLPQGSYLYRIVTRQGEVTGKVQLTL